VLLEEKYKENLIRNLNNELRENEIADAEPAGVMATPKQFFSS